MSWNVLEVIKDYWAFHGWLIVKCTKMHEGMREKTRLPVMDVNNSLSNLQDVNSRHVNSVFNKRWDVQLSWAFALTRVWGSFTCLGSFRSLHQFTRSRQIVDTLHRANTSRKRQTNTQTETNKKHKNYFTAERSRWFTRKWLTHHWCCPTCTGPPSLNHQNCKIVWFIISLARPKLKYLYVLHLCFARLHAHRCLRASPSEVVVDMPD